MPHKTARTRLREFIAGEAPAILTTQELVDELRLAEDTLQHALARLIADGEVIRVSRGRYTASDPSTGGPKAHEFAIALAPFTDAAIAGWSAAAHWNLTDQVPHEIDVAVPEEFRNPHFRSRLFEKVRVQPVTRDLWFGIEDVWVADGQQVKMFSRARVVLDALLFPARWGGSGATRELLDTDTIFRPQVDELRALVASHELGLGPKRVHRLEQWLRLIPWPDQP